ncbi:MAG TPA: ABC transporter substrate-binding protein [Geobacterales bacterium]|nr:ABC transporter substrate-binding protein [Geobacterales bacterium]
MVSRRAKCLWRMAAGVAILLTFGQAVWGAPVIVVNRDNPLSELTMAEVRQMFLGRTMAWSDGVLVEPVVQRGEIQDVFVGHFLGKSRQQYTIYWKKQLFTGKGLPPPELPDDRGVRSFVSRQRGAIGYIDEQAVDGTVKRIIVTE